jgi:hypothetical protein
MRERIWLVMLATVLGMSGGGVVEAGIDVWTAIGPDGGTIPSRRPRRDACSSPRAVRRRWGDTTAR